MLTRKYVLRRAPELIRLLREDGYRREDEGENGSLELEAAGIIEFLLEDRASDQAHKQSAAP